MSTTPVPRSRSRPARHTCGNCCVTAPVLNCGTRVRREWLEPRDAADRSVPGFGGPNARAGSADGQAALRLHAVIAVIAFVLCAFVSGIFFWMGTPVLG